MDNRLKVVGGVGLGAGLLFLLDPAGGRRGFPAARLLVSAAGGGLALYGATRRDRIGAALGSLGVGLLVRGLTDLTLRPRADHARQEELREVQRAIHVDAAPAKVFALWVDYDNFPRLFSRVREVRDEGDGRSRWVLEGSAGMPVEWDVVLTRFETERELAWRTAGDPDQAQQLQVLFTPDAESGTRVEVRLSCAPTASLSGQDAGTLFGVDPERQMEEDLVRMKTHVEST